MLILEDNTQDKLNLLKNAIENKYEISFWYVGEKLKNPGNKKYTRQNWRFAQPSALGKSAKEGFGDRWMLRAWQTGGVTNTTKPAWKTFLVDEMSGITVMDGKMGGYKTFNNPASGYNSNGDKKMKGGKPDITLNTNQPGLDLSKTVNTDEVPQLKELKLLNILKNGNNSSRIV